MPEHLIIPYDESQKNNAIPPDTNNSKIARDPNSHYIVNTLSWPINGSLFICNNTLNDTVKECDVDTTPFYNDPSKNNSYQDFSITYFFGCRGPKDAPIAIIDGDGHQHCGELQRNSDVNSTCEIKQAQGPLSFAIINSAQMKKSFFIKEDTCQLKIIDIKYSINKKIK
jgi:hypothetical protein